MNDRSILLDSSWRRLPWLAGASLLFWGVVIYGFALFLGHMSTAPDLQAPVDAELIEERVPPKPAPVPKQQIEPRIVHERKPAPPAEPRQIQAQPVRETPSLPPGPPAEAPASSTPVSLPEAGPPSGNALSREAGLPAFQTRPSAPPAPAAGSAATPPRFGAAYLNNPPPSYPAAARKLGIEGTVMLKVLVSREGKALEIEVVQSAGEILDKSAAEAVKNWRFVPARRGDSAVDEWVQVPLAFRLKR